MTTPAAVWPRLKICRRRGVRVGENRDVRGCGGCGKASHGALDKTLKYGHNFMAMTDKQEQPGTAEQRVGSADFKSRCLELVDRVKEARAEYVVTRHGVPVARLVPVEAGEPVSLVGALNDTVVRYDDPFEPIPATWTLDGTSVL